MGIYQFKNLHTGMTPSQNPNAKFRVAKFKSKCHSISYYITLLNTKDSYKSFRNERELQSKLRVNDVNRYFNLLYNYSTNPEYPQLLIRNSQGNYSFRVLMWGFSGPTPFVYSSSSSSISSSRSSSSSLH
jgi:hypothetical protein